LDTPERVLDGATHFLLMAVPQHLAKRRGSQLLRALVDEGIRSITNETLFFLELPTILSPFLNAMTIPSFVKGT
jgi:hypothetical protein